MRRAVRRSEHLLNGLSRAERLSQKSIDSRHRKRDSRDFREIEFRRASPPSSKECQTNSANELRIVLDYFENVNNASKSSLESNCLGKLNFRCREYSRTRLIILSYPQQVNLKLTLVNRFLSKSQLQMYNLSRNNASARNKMSVITDTPISCKRHS